MPRLKPHARASSSAVKLSRRRSARPRNRSARPSSTLSALFAIVAASTAADAYPLSSTSPPPEFLCPGLGSSFGPDACPDTSVADLPPATTASTTAFPAATQTHPAGVPIADKYVTGIDGRWRKTDMVTLYGSTVCLVESCNAAPSSTFDDYAIDPSSVAATTAYPASVVTFPPTSFATAIQSSTVTSSSLYTTTPVSSTSEYPSSLPSGWPDVTNKADEALTPVIIVLSIVLAFAICIFIVMPVVLRRKRRARLRDREKKVDGEREKESDEGTDDAMHARFQQRLWAKATAKWKAKARQAARRRKRAALGPKEIATRLLAETSSDDQSSVIISPSFIKRRPSVPGAINDASNIDSSPRPPAYPSAPDGLLRRRHSHLPRPELARSKSSARELLVDSQAGDPFVDSTSAHVATDDKAVLARMVDLASAPPHASGLSGQVSQAPGGPYASVPPLEDDFEEIPCQLRVFDSEDAKSSHSHPHYSVSGHVPSYTRDPSLNPSILPPPPPKSRMAAPTFYDYPVSFEEDIGLEPDVGPSAPPFQNDEGSAPSAPPLEFDYDPQALGEQPSAPALDYLEQEPGSLERCVRLDEPSRVSSEPTSPSPRDDATSPAPACTPVQSVWRQSPPGYLP